MGVTGREEELSRYAGSDLGDHKGGWWCHCERRRQMIKSAGLWCGLRPALSDGHRSPSRLAALGHNLKTLTVNGTISTFWYSSDRSNSSATFNSTERVLKSLVRPWSQQLLVS